MLGNRYSQHSFAQIPAVNMARSSFDRSFNVKDTIAFDYLTPVFIDEILPGDTANLNVNCFARLATQLVPIMDNLYLDFFFFFVPNRLIWTNWEKFCGAQDNPGDSTSYTIPQVSVTSTTSAGGIAEKLGIPLNAGASLSVNSLPFRVYQKVWNQWFRDENLQNMATETSGDGPDTYGNYALLKRGKRHDYFTSALPWPQKGTALSIPLGTSAPVTRVSSAASWRAYNAGSNTDAGANNPVKTDASGYLLNTAGTNNLSLDPGTGGLIADLSSATAATINQLRQAWQIQSLLELDARGGTRYTEILMAHFNVTSPDFRLQRPEYLGGGEVTINSHVVPQTSSTSGSNYLAQTAAFATGSSVGGRIGFTKSFVEHGYVIGLVCPRADITYQQGINKMWLRSTRYDFFWPKLQEIGEQTILNKEIYVANDGSNDSVFGYQERYAEYRFKPSEIHGAFRSTCSAPVDMWHMAQNFSSRPSLNSSFIQQSTPITRALANSSAEQVIIDIFYSYKHARPMLTYSVPSVLGRF